MVIPWNERARPLLRQYKHKLAGLWSRYYRLVVHAGALYPLARLAYRFLLKDLTANPIQFLTQRTGDAALVLLVSSLACTPLYSVFGLKEALKARRTLGLYAFLYASLHFLTFFGLDYGFQLGLVWLDVSEKKYIYVGASAFLILALLAVTSFNWWKRRLGKNWKRLQRSVYLANLLVVAHYIWVVKSDIRIPLLHGAIVLSLLTLRIPAVRRTLRNLRFRLANKKTA